MNLTKILIVDDEPDILEIFGIELRNRGYHVQIAQDGNEALGQARKFEPDVLISDISMPNLDGIKLIKSFKETEAFRNLPIIIVSGNTDDEKRLELERAGADAYFEKPINFDHLDAKIENLLQKYESFNQDTDVRFSGKIEEISLLEVCQLFHQSRKSGTLNIRSKGSARGQLKFDNGEIYFAALPPFFGIAGFHHFIRVHEGEFRLTQNKGGDIRNIWTASGQLIMQGATNLDEFDIEEINSQLFISISQSFWRNGRKYLTDLSKDISGISNVSIIEKSGRILLSLDNDMLSAIELASIYLNLCRISLEDNSKHKRDTVLLSTAEKYVIFMTLKANFVFCCELEKNTQIGVIINKLQKKIKDINSILG